MRPCVSAPLPPPPRHGRPAPRGAQELIEYREGNDDGVYTPGVDEVLHSISLWDKEYVDLTAELSAIPATKDYGLSSFNITSADGVVSLEFSATPRLDTDDPTYHHQLRSPNGTRVTMRVQGEPMLLSR